MNVAGTPDVPAPRAEAVPLAGLAEHAAGLFVPHIARSTIVLGGLADVLLYPGSSVVGDRRVEAGAGVACGAALDEALHRPWLVLWHYAECLFTTACGGGIFRFQICRGRQRAQLWFEL